MVLRPNQLNVWLFSDVYLSMKSERWQNILHHVVICQSWYTAMLNTQMSILIRSKYLDPKVSNPMTNPASKSCNLFTNSPWHQGSVTNRCKWMLGFFSSHFEETAGCILSVWIFNICSLCITVLKFETASSKKIGQTKYARNTWIFAHVKPNTPIGTQLEFTVINPDDKTLGCNSKSTKWICSRNDVRQKKTKWNCPEKYFVVKRAFYVFYIMFVPQLSFSGAVSASLHRCHFNAGGLN